MTSDIDLKSDQFSIRGKGGKVRVVLFLMKQKAILEKKYMDLRKDFSEALFVKVPKKYQEEKTNKLSPGKPLTRRSVERIVKNTRR